MRKLYQFVSISLVIGLTLSIIFSYINAGGEYYPISPVTTLGKLYYSHLSEPIVMLIAICLWLLIGALFYLANFLVKSRLLCKMLYNVFTISTYQN
ncbi:hypothetical protein [Staphylococcus haemolyticus]|uniref:hypothetical protein n=1 Tax=Staphylococcus haemolyticus TaxID=1283 RepID=UPI000AD79340|nr:hypothetical protein [Staphylococcus haemolyticus]